MRFESLSKEEPADPGVVPMTSLDAPAACALSHDEHSLQIAVENLKQEEIVLERSACLKLET